MEGVQRRHASHCRTPCRRAGSGSVEAIPATSLTSLPPSVRSTMGNPCLSTRCPRLATVNFCSRTADILPKRAL